MRTPLALSLVWLIAIGAQAQDDSAADPSEESEPTQAQGADEAARESARAHFKLGVDFYRERNFRAALIEFQRAYADAPHFKLLYNLGQASLELQEYARAIDYFTDYLDKGGNEIAQERRAEVEQHIRYLETRLATVTITSNEDGAEIYIDDTLAGRAPLASPVRVGAGRHTFSARKAGRPPVERTIDVAAGDNPEVSLEFAEALAPVAASVEPTTQVIRLDSPPNTPAIWAGVTTAAIAAGAITLTVMTAVAQNDYENERETETTRDKLDSLRDDAETKALITDILWGATLVSGIVTTVLIATGGEPEEDVYGSNTIRLGASPSGVALSGSF